MSISAASGSVLLGVNRTVREACSAARVRVLESWESPDVHLECIFKLQIQGFPVESRELVTADALT